MKTILKRFSSITVWISLASFTSLILDLCGIPRSQALKISWTIIAGGLFVIALLTENGKFSPPRFGAKKARPVLPDSTPAQPSEADRGPEHEPEPDRKLESNPSSQPASASQQNAGPKAAPRKQHTRKQVKRHGRPRQGKKHKR